MRQRIRQTLGRVDYLAEDILGCLALTVILVGSLHLPLL